MRMIAQSFIFLLYRRRYPSPYSVFPPIVSNKGSKGFPAINLLFVDKIALKGDIVRMFDRCLFFFQETLLNLYISILQISTHHLFL